MPWPLRLNIPLLLGKPGLHLHSQGHVAGDLQFSGHHRHHRIDAAVADAAQGIRRSSDSHVSNLVFVGDGRLVAG